MEFSFTFAKQPTTIDELKALPEASLDSAYKTAALAMVSLLNFKDSEELTYELLDYLKGPESVSPYEKQFIKERLAGKEYKVDSFFAGATPENGYTPSMPLTITVSDTPNSFAEENWAIVFVKSSGADSPRQIKLRKKPSTGEWFINEIMCLSDIRVPVALDPWA